MFMYNSEDPETELRESIKLEHTWLTSATAVFEDEHKTPEVIDDILPGGYK